MTTLKAFRIHNDDGQHRAGIEQIGLAELGDDEVLIRTHYSSVNYKDALAGTGTGRILRRFPLIGGIDSAGEVAESSADGLAEGDRVVVTGCGLSATHDGGYAEWLRVPADWVVPLPEGLTLYQAMALGSAGFTAALAIHRMEQNGQTPEHGPIVVTGASGGVGSIAVNMLAGRGYPVTAVSGKSDQHDYLRELGAAEVVGRQELALASQPLEQGRWGGIVDNVGGDMLAGLLPCVRPWGNVASIGLAGGHKLRTTVMPFILRGVSLLGINSADCAYPLRKELWQRLASDLKPALLDSIVDRVVELEDLPGVFTEMLEGRTKGRILVRTTAEES